MNKSTITKLLNEKLSPQKKSNFDVEKEAEHIVRLCDDCQEFGRYTFKEFINYGGSGMVFKVLRKNDGFYTALKIARVHLFSNDNKSIFACEELDALKDLAHENIVRLFDTITHPQYGVVAICTSYVNNPEGLDEYLYKVLESNNKGGKTSDSKKDNTKKQTHKMESITVLSEFDKNKYYAVSPERLDKACRTIFGWVSDIAQAINFMHKNNYFHMDIKPANILIMNIKEPNSTRTQPILTDMGSCLRKNTKIDRAHFTWAYAHPDLTDVKSNVNSFTPEALRVSADIKHPENLHLYDLYAFGKSIQQLLAIVENHFGKLCYSNYTFRYLHLISALLLDGKNSATSDDVSERHGIYFVTAIPQGHTLFMLSQKKITSATELVDRLRRYQSNYSICELAPEFGIRNMNIINNTLEGSIPFSKRVNVIFNHPTMRRLLKELQLGLVIEIYPGASHNRWSHSLGVFNRALQYYSSLLSDPENPMFLICATKSDLNHAFLAAILHDVGQTSMGHDFELIIPQLSHSKYVENLLEEESSQGPLIETIEDYWEDIDIERIIKILKGISTISIDGVATDIINGAIDADKLDYIERDSHYCGVAYGKGVDYERLISSLTIVEHNRKLRLAYYSKGRTAIASLLLARYQLYGAIYWHHTFRGIIAMLSYSLVIAKKHIEDGYVPNLTMNQFCKLYYYRIVCKKTWLDSISCTCKSENISLSNQELKDKYGYLFSETGMENDPSLDFVYRFTTEQGKQLLKSLSERWLYKRIYSRSLKEVDTAQLLEICDNKLEISFAIQEKLLQAIQEKLNNKKGRMTAIDKEMSQDLVNLSRVIRKNLYVIIDFPTKIGIPAYSWPKEIGDSARKQLIKQQDDSKEIVNSSNDLLKGLATFRVFSNPEFYQIITRYLLPDKIEECIQNAIYIL